MKLAEINFCVRCGTILEMASRFGKRRPTCPICNWSYLPDPKVAVSVFVEESKKVLLVRRSNEPECGLWSFPGGYLDAGEDPIQAAERECREETGLQAHVTDFLVVFSAAGQARGADLVLVYRADVISGKLQAGDDADEANFFARDRLPPLAFKTTKQLLGVA